ncbi:MAG TPA: hypothetical protein VLQ93_09750 [Myxococcaceae bacterium]|nr:hypothetical protein [Myxococcaceae bacterium]
MALTASGCAPKVIDEDLLRPNPGEPFLEKLPGPLAESFDSFSDALLAACKKIITKPNAVAPREDAQDFDTYWRAASEYCAWIYYTPDHKYELSKLTDQSKVDPANRKKKCLLPSVVEDRRYPPDAIRYICALHNHPYASTLSPDDMRYIVEAGSRRGKEPYYGFLSETLDGARLLSIVAFFSNHVLEPTCDGFYQYFPLTGQLLKMTNTEGQWRCEQVGLVRWDDEGDPPIIEKAQGPCTQKGTP